MLSTLDVYWSAGPASTVVRQAPSSVPGHGFSFFARTLSKWLLSG